MSEQTVSVEAVVNQIHRERPRGYHRDYATGLIKSVELSSTEEVLIKAKEVTSGQIIENIPATGLKLDLHSHIRITVEVL